MATISSLTARKILNSRGEWTLSVELEDEDGTQVSDSAPEGESKGIFEAEYVKPEHAVEQVQSIVAPALKGMDSKDQFAVDRKLVELEVGANVKIGVSRACARLGAESRRMPLWKHISEIYQTKPAAPRLFINVLEGGMHAHNNLVFQEYLAIPKANTIARSVEIGRRVYKALRDELKADVGDEGGLVANFKDALEPLGLLGREADIDLGMDAAANNVDLPPAELFALYRQMNLFYLEDPFKENDFENFKKLKEEMGEKSIIAGDDLTTTNLARMRKAKEEDAINGVIIKPDQIGTLTQAMEAVRQAREWGWAVVVSHRGGETNDDFVADLAWAVAADGLKLGGLARGERIAKYNRLLAIEEDEA